jgi:hypothetical protein
MDLGEPDGGGFSEEQPKKPRELPPDLPKSLDDRKHVPTELVRETEFYDGWQGSWSFQFATTGLPGSFNILTLVFQENPNS